MRHWKKKKKPMAGVLPCSSSTLSLLTPLNFHSQDQCRPLHSHSLNTQRNGLFVCAAKKKVSFTDQILDYIEGKHLKFSSFSLWYKVSSGPNWVNFFVIWLFYVHICCSVLSHCVWLCEGGPKLRKWYGAPELLPKDGSLSEDEDELSGGCSGMWRNLCMVM